ncbi:MAG: hypothetical protein HY930_01640 [Euryarchaeota archaeon]|nr:hypothetical protein [Euryarchaeota archaeon]
MEKTSEKKLIDEKKFNKLSLAEKWKYILEKEREIDERVRKILEKT